MSRCAPLVCDNEVRTPCRLLTTFGAGSGVRVGLKDYFNDQNEEAKTLASQLELLKNHLGGSFEGVSYA